MRSSEEISDAAIKMVKIGGLVLGVLFVLAIAFTGRINDWYAARLGIDVQSIINTDSINPTSPGMDVFLAFMTADLAFCCAMIIKVIPIKNIRKRRMKTLACLVAATALGMILAYGAVHEAVF